MSELEAVRAEMKAMTDAILASKSDPATFDFETVKDQFSDEIEKMVAEQVKEQEDKRPAFKGSPVYADGVGKAIAEVIVDEAVIRIATAMAVDRIGQPIESIIKIIFPVR